MAITVKQPLGFHPIHTSNIPGRDVLVDTIRQFANIVAPWLEDGNNNPKPVAAIVRRVKHQLRHLAEPLIDWC